jgi:hypothetical protein
MNRLESYKLIWSVAKNLHRSQAKTLVVMVICLVDSGKMRSFDIAHAMADRFAVLFKSAIQRFYRFIHNRKLDDIKVWSEMADHVLMSVGRKLVVSIDWTEWHDHLRVLVASACVGRRAIPIFAQTFSKTDIPRSQNTREDTFVKMLGMLSPMVRAAILIFDRGFRRASLIKLLNEHGYSYVIRLISKVKVTGKRYAGLLRDYPLSPGQMVDLGVCRYRSDGIVTVRIIGVWAHGQKEPWWLATSMEKKRQKGGGTV